MNNKSEQLFEQYCDSNEIPWTRIPVEGSRTPDYAIRLGEVEVVCEIKQVEESEVERAAFASVPHTGEGCAWIAPNQLRPILKDLSQLKAAASAGKPTILETPRVSRRLVHLDATHSVATS